MKKIDWSAVLLTALVAIALTAAIRAVGPRIPIVGRVAEYV